MFSLMRLFCLFCVLKHGKKCDMSALIESKSRGPWFCKRVETWGAKCAFLKIRGPKSQVCETWGPKVHLSKKKRIN